MVSEVDKEIKITFLASDHVYVIACGTTWMGCAKALVEQLAG